MGAGASTSQPEEDNESVQFKLKGDSSYQLGSMKETIYWYTKALGQIPPQFDESKGSSSAPTSAEDVMELRAVILGNRSAAYLNLEQYVSALADAQRVIDLKPVWHKGYYRAALACYHLGRLEEARPMIEKAVAILPRNTTLIDLRAKIFGEDDHAGIATRAAVGEKRGAGAFMTDEPQSLAPAGKTVTTTRPRRKHLGAVYSWGQGDAGQLGQGNSVHKKDSPSVISKLEGYHIIEVAAGALHSVAISGTAETFSWGDNNHNQLGFPMDNSIVRNNTVAIPRLIPKLVGLQATAVACGAGHSLVLMENGSVYGFGMNAQGQLGLGRDDEDSRVVAEPEKLPFFDELLKQSNKRCVGISTGIGHSCFLMDNGTLFSTGMNTYGQLGLGDKKPRYSPQEVAFSFDGSQVKHISCGGGHTLVCTQEGNLFTCGSNSCGQLGTTNLIDADTFQLVSIDDHSDAANVTAVAIATATSVVNVNTIPVKFAYVHAGEEFSAFITRNKHVYTCGLGMAGSLGHGNYENLKVPTEIKSLSLIEMLCASGQSQVYAVKSSGEVYMWGGGAGLEGLVGVGNNLAQAGDDAMHSNANSATPIRVSILSKRKSVRQFICGRKHNLIVVNGGYGPNCHVIKGLVASNVQEYADTIDGETLAKEKEKDRLCGLLSGDKDTPSRGGEAEGTNAVNECDEESKVEEHRPVLNLAFRPLTTVEAGKKLSFVIQSRDIQNQLMETPGAVFQSSLSHLDSIDYELRVQRQGLELTHKVFIDDNLDGQYSGSCRLFLTGTYSLSITLDGLPISGSPFELSVYPGQLLPSRCFCWFGSFAVKEGAIDKKDGYGERVECMHGQSIVFTVSSRDKYSNKCDATEHEVLVKAEYLGPWISDDDLALGAEEKEGDGPSQTTGAAKMTSAQSFPGSSLGLFPCAIDTREMRSKSRYLLHVAIDYFHSTKAVQGSPFQLDVRDVIEVAPALMDEEIAREDVPIAEEKIKDAGTEEKDEALVKEVTSLEITQRRAEEAFKKFKAESKARKERERAAKKAKRTGGGFIIYYSKDI